MSQPSARCKVTNWKEYNASLVRRGDLTLWFDEAVLNQWQAIQPTGRRGRPKVCADLAVQCLLALPVPNHTTLCRRTWGQTLRTSPATRPSTPPG